MHACRKFAFLFWMAVLFAIAGAQTLHAWHQLACEESHGVQEASHNSCSTEHSCCHTHFQPVAITGSAALPPVPGADMIWFSQDSRYSGGVLDEIEHPPRLS